MGKQRIELRATRYDKSTTNDGNEDSLILEFPPALYIRFLPLLIELQREGYNLYCTDYYTQTLISEVSYNENKVQICML